MCQNFCDNKEDAEEVVQDTFLIAFKKSGSLKSDTLMGYLRKIAIHESLRKRKANQRLQQYVVNMEDEQTENYPEQNHDFLPEAYLQDKESRTELLRIIKSLPKKQWEMIYMYYYANFSAKEIAQLCGCSENNVHKTLSNARKTIKSKIENKDNTSTFSGMAGVPLAAILFMEEQVFAASYIPAIAPCVASAGVGIAAGADIAGKAVAATAKSTAGYIVAACVAVVCSVSVVAYVAAQLTADNHEPVYEIHTPAPEEPPLLPIEEPIEAEEPYEPEPIDRTPEILEALAKAETAEDVSDIIDYFGFVFATHIRVDMWYRFYVLDEGSGDILVGMSAYEDGTDWQMRFKHYLDGIMPSDTLELLQFMEQ